MSIMATKKIRSQGCYSRRFYRRVRNVVNGVSSERVIVCLRVSTGVTGSQKRGPRYSWDGSCGHLAAVGAPAGAGGRKGLGDGGTSGRFRLYWTSTEHDTASEDGGLSTIVVGDLGLGVVNKDLGGTGTFPARHLWV